MARVHLIAAFAVASSAVLSAAVAATTLLTRETIIPLSEVTKYFPDVTTEAGTGSNETKIGSPAASLGCWTAGS